MVKKRLKKRLNSLFFKTFGIFGVVLLVASVLVYKFHNFGWLGKLISEFAIIGIISIATAIFFLIKGKKFN